MAGDEVRNELLAQIQFAIDAVEYLLKLTKLMERRLAHDVEHTVAGMSRGLL